MGGWGGGKKKEQEEGRKLYSTLLAVSGVNFGTRVVLMPERTPQEVVHLTAHTSCGKEELMSVCGS
jgi:hypothetical protein